MSDLVVNILERDLAQTNEFKNSVLESALLPILEGFLRSGSLIEMAKSSSINKSCLDLVEALSKNEETLDLLEPIDERYEPSQLKSIADLLT
jgi:hypothetical protein